MASPFLNQKHNYQAQRLYNAITTNPNPNPNPNSNPNTNVNPNSNLNANTIGNGYLMPNKQEICVTPKQGNSVAASNKILTLSTTHNIQPLNIKNQSMIINKKRYSYGTLPYGMEQLPSVARRNARERNRVKQVNNGFANLRQHIPQTVITALSHGGRGASKKLSKVDTLRIAVEYIRGLQKLLESTHTTANAIRTENPYTTDFQDDCSSDANSFECSSVNSIEDNIATYQLSQSPNLSYSNSLTNSTLNDTKTFIESIKLENSEEPDYNFSSFEQPDDEELLDYISTWQDE